ncbi:MAG: NADH-quinone oxidoreductase subunit H [Anaerolineales bacterium]|nr:NADH-quinone oxidoreductase subunit H [Anaerolineales bacterium]
MADTFGQIAVGLLQGIVILLGAPLLVGILQWLKERLQLRRGPGPLQIYRDLGKRCARPAMRPTSSGVTAVTPYVLVAAYGLLAFMVPVISPMTLLQGDFILVIYLLGLARFMLSLAGLDGGAPFAGLGVSREMFLQFLTEIGFGLLVVGLAVRWGTTDMAVVFKQHWDLGITAFLGEPELVVLGLALFCLTLLEAERLPVEHPATNLELTRAQSNITSEFSGRDYESTLWPETIKLVFLVILAAQLFVPMPYAEFPQPWMTGPLVLVASIVGFLVRISLLIVGLAVWEVIQPKQRLRAAPRIALISMVFSTVAILYTLAFPA